MCPGRGAVLMWVVRRAQSGRGRLGFALQTLGLSSRRVPCSRCCQLGNLEGSCRKGGFTAAAAEQCLWLLPHRCSQARAEQVSAAGVGEALPGSERSCCRTAVTAACARVCSGMWPCLLLEHRHQLRCRSCPSLDTRKARSVGQCKSPEALKQVHDFPFSLERTGQSPEMRLCCANQQLAPLPSHSALSPVPNTAGLALLTTAARACSLNP